MLFLNVNIDIFRRCDEIYVLDFHWGTKVDKIFNNHLFFYFFSKIIAVPADYSYSAYLANLAM